MPDAHKNAPENTSKTATDRDRERDGDARSTAEEAASCVSLLIVEVDGVLTDGQAWRDADGRWRRRFSVRDSIALRALRKAGVSVAIVTRSKSPEIGEHASLVGFDACVEGADDKRETLRSLMQRLNADSSHMAAIIESDEDSWMCGELGFVAATAGASEAAKSNADYLTKSEGGDGAVREVCNWILAARERAGRGPKAKRAAGQ